MNNINGWAVNVQRLRNSFKDPLLVKVTSLLLMLISVIFRFSIRILNFKLHFSWRMREMSVCYLTTPFRLMVTFYWINIYALFSTNFLCRGTESLRAANDKAWSVRCVRDRSVASGRGSRSGAAARLQGDFGFEKTGSRARTIRPKAVKLFAPVA